MGPAPELNVPDWDDTILDLCDQVSHELGLSLVVNRGSYLVACYLGDWVPLQNHEAICIVAASVYMVSHLLCEPESAMRISAVTDIHERHIIDVYRVAYPIRGELVGLDSSLRALHWPPF